MMSHKVLIEENLANVSYGGITAITDTFLLKNQTEFKDIFLMLNVYGSLIQLKGIFAALVTFDKILIDTSPFTKTASPFNKQVRKRHNKETFLRFKSFKVGYGKYQAFIYDEYFLSECVIAKKDNQINAWETFLNKKKIPYLTQWLPKIIDLLTEKNLIRQLHGIGQFIGWHWLTSDDEVCDLIVSNKIYQLK